MNQDMQQPSRLYVRNGNGRYTVATPDRVVEAARAVAERRVQRGQSFSDPTLASRFFRTCWGPWSGKSLQRLTSTPGID